MLERHRELIGLWRLLVRVDDSIGDAGNRPEVRPVGIEVDLPRVVVAVPIPVVPVPGRDRQVVPGDRLQLRDNLAKVNESPPSTLDHGFAVAKHVERGMQARHDGIPLVHLDLVVTQGIGKLSRIAALLRRKRTVVGVAGSQAER